MAEPAPPCTPEPLDGEALAAWLWLIGLRGLGAAGRLALLRAFGLPQAVRAAGPAAWADCLGRRPQAPDPADLAAALQATLAWRAAGPDRVLLPLGDPAYPRALLDLADPPLLLHAEGRLAGLQAPAVAVVGSRQASPQGRLDAEAFARELAARGWLVVSGLARGIDAAAHEGALRAAGGAGTLAVLGTGLDCPYPRAHAGLARRIAADGLLLSEHPPGTPPLAAHFPRRNRLIAALARGTLVVEAALASGSLITARLAAELGREVFALPGSIHHPLARGGHRLIKEGAMLVESVDDILGALAWGGGPGPAGGPQAGASPPTDPIYPIYPIDPIAAALGPGPLGLDELVDRLGEPAPRLQARLLELELRGEVARLPGGRYQRLHRG